MNPIFDLFNTSLIFWEIVTFVILLFLLYRYVYPPIRDQIQRRQSEIEQAIDEAQKTRAEARELLAEYRRQIEEARGEARQILDEARKQGEAARERERDAALRELRREVADMVIVATERIIRHELDREEHERLISEALESLEAEVAGETR